MTGDCEGGYQLCVVNGVWLGAYSYGNLEKPCIVNPDNVQGNAPSWPPPRPPKPPPSPPGICHVDSGTIPGRNSRNLTSWLVRAMNEQSNGWPASGISGFVQGSNTQLNAGLVMSMISRSSGVAQTGLGLAPRSVGYAWWYEMVKDGARWDFKDQIKAELGSSAMYCDSESCDWYEYSTSGNIFYAYIGRVLGFSEFELRSGAVVAQQGDPENDPIANTWYGLDQASDQAAIELGFMIYNMIGRSPSEEGMMMAFKNLLKIRKSGLQHISEPTSSYRAPFPLGVNGPEFPLSYFDGTNGIGSLGRE